MEHIFPRRNRRESSETRWLFGVGGGLMLFWGLKRRSLVGNLSLVAGIDLLIRGLTGHHLYEAAGITAFTPKGKGARVPNQLGIQAERSVTINRPPEEVYGFVRNLENVMRFSDAVKSVTVNDETHSRWVLRGPGGTDLKWDAEIINNIPNELIGWRSIDSPDVEIAGAIHFQRAPRDRGTIVRVTLRVMPPAGSFGALLAKVIGKDPEQQLRNELRRLKEFLEVRAIPTTEGHPVGAHGNAPKALHT